MEKSAVHVNPQIKPKLNHNDRTDLKAKTIHQEYTHLNECTTSADQVKQEFDKLYKEAYNNFYTYCDKKTKEKADKEGKPHGKPKGLQNFAKKENAMQEMIFEISDKTTLQQCQTLADKIAELTGFTVLQVAIHRDEGHKQDEQFTTHYHAHAVFFSLDKENGTQLARQAASLNKKNLSKMQDLASEILEMERGKEYYKNKEPSPNYPKNYRDYKAIKDETRRQEQELIKKYENKALELQNKEKMIKDKGKELNQRENTFKINLNAIMKDQQELENDINIKYRNKRKGILYYAKNIFSGGKYAERLERERNAELNALRAQANTAKKNAEKKAQELKRRNDELETEREQLKERNNKLQAEMQQEHDKYISSERHKIAYQKKLREYAKILKENASDEFLQKEAPELKKERDKEQQQAKQRTHEYSR